MSKNIATYITLVILIVASIFGFFSMNQLNNNAQIIGDNAGTFPQLVCVFIVVFSIISIIQTAYASDVHIKLPNMKLVLGTVFLAIGFILIWDLLDMFYIGAALFVFLTFWMYSKDKKDYKRLLKVGVPITFGTVLCIYLFFEKAMALRL